MKQLFIIQPYIPSYRAEFFKRLAADLEQKNIKLTLLAGSPPKHQSNRQDAVELDFQVPTESRRIAIGRRSINASRTYAHWKHADGVIVGLEGSSLDLYEAIARRRYSKLAVGVWGHVKSYVARGNPLDLALEKWQMNHVDHVFAYTAGGAAAARVAGVSEQAITDVRNSVDTSSLESARRYLQKNPERVNDLKARYGITTNSVLAYVGGLDAAKRISFLTRALDELWTIAPETRLLVAGKGNEAHLLNRAIARGQVIMLGYADAELKAFLGLVARAFVMPGRVGLIAVETMLLRRPLLTTDWEFHSAELEYLAEGVTRFTSADDPRAYAELMSQAAVGRLSPAEHTNEAWSYPTLEGMVTRYSSGVQRMMGSKK